MPDHPHARRASASGRSRCFSDADRSCATCGHGRRGGQDRPGPAAAPATSTRSGSSTPRRSHRRRRGAPRVRVPLRECGVRRLRSRRRASRSSARRRSRSAGSGAKDSARALAAAAGVPLLPGSRAVVDPRRRDRSRAADRFPAAGEERRRRRRDRHARVPAPRRTSPAVGGDARCARASRPSGRARCSSSAWCAGRATSRCRRSATARAASSCSATATARRSGAARRWSRRRLRRNLDDEMRAALFDAAVRLLEPIRYRSAGTVEFVVDADSGEFAFLEVNTRLQVEHARHRGGHRRRSRGVDGPARGRRRRAACATTCTHPDGHSIEVRVYAEDPVRELPAERRRRHRSALAGCGARRHVGAHRHRGHAVLRPAARQARRARGRPRRARSTRCATRSTRPRIAGIETNCGLHRARSSRRRSFVDGAVHTEALAAHRSRPAHDRGPRRGQLHDRAGPSRPGRLLARRRASERADGRSVVRARQRDPRQSSGRAAGSECTATGPTLRVDADARVLPHRRGT